MGLIDKMRNAIKSFLQIEPALNTGVTIMEQMDFETNAAKNRIWYRGDGWELSQLYKQIGGDRSMFWAAVPTRGMEIRKVHTGVPKLIVDILTAVVMADMNDIKLPDELTERWDSIVKENEFKTLIGKAVTETLVIGDGAFKISLDGEISSDPIIEFYSGDKVDFVYKRGRITEIVFKTFYRENASSYVLYEHYGYGYVRYELMKGNSKVDLSCLPQTSELVDVTFDKRVLMAVPLYFCGGSIYEGRGRSIFDGKCDNFDSLDEIWSQWLYAVRQSRPMKFLPPAYSPKNPYTGEDLKPNPFDNIFIESSGPVQETTTPPRPELIQPDIPHESYLAAYITALDLCLQGIISPSTLGIDVKKLDNAEAQREKEKTTLYTRNKIVGVLQLAIPELIRKVFYVIAVANDEPLPDIDVDVPFGEYANPSFESQVETVGKGRTQGIMSIEAAVDELYGDTKDDDWKAAEVQRIKAQTGTEMLNEPVFTE